MADEAKYTEAAPAKSGAMGKVLLLGGVVVIAALAGLATFKFVLAPKLGAASPESGHEEPAAAKESHGAHGEEGAPGPSIVSFDESIANVIMPDTNMLASLLLFKVSLDCANKETADLIEAYKPRFNDLINQAHSFRTRQELNDPLVKQSIAKQIVQNANDALKKIQESQGKVDPKIAVTDVYHDKFAVQDQ